NKSMADAFVRAEERALAADPYLPRLDRRWGSEFGNRPLPGRSVGELPDALGPFREYTAYPDAGLGPRGAWRVVIGKNSEVFTSWTHYGTANPALPFFRAR